ncbi:signal peptide peptidase SppA [Campylobacter sp. RM9328]|uniref:signal peptide peptidase SppA n=1 Tax=Campylobacter sp. RM9328 TaxID=1705720 RepID=UPI00147507C8|nr:signal peptide peptidase SppA [Campylobacter sp. RM9328]
MQLLKMIFAPIGAIFKFINTNFKAFVFLLILAMIFMPDGEMKKPNLAQVDIKNTLLQTEDILEKLQALNDDDSIKGVLLYIDSPGGALSPSVELAMQVKKLAKNKKVVAYAAGSMTSGSYYAGVNAHKIVANPGSFIGSIGVIMQVPNLEALADKIGISEQVVKAGEFKEAGTFTRKWSQSERDSLQKLVDASYELFTSDVAQARGLETSKKDEWANAKIFLAGEAKQVGLIDEIGGYFEAKAQLEELSGVSEAVWEKKPQIEKFMEKFTSQGVNSMANLLFNTQMR